ncbi:MAG: TIR domain-containing protein [Ignavibacteriales bacterium]|nr:MAG: TIR domain-containing protein [Ignavibacteriales bacterium]
METNSKIKIFISYSHANDNYLDEFLLHLKQLEKSQNVEVWCDRQIKAGEIFINVIKENINTADILCCLVSKEYLASNTCNEEKNIGMELEIQTGIKVVPIILTNCAWQDDEYFRKTLAIPKDGKPVCEFSPDDAGWMDVYEKIKNLIEDRKKLCSIKIKQEFLSKLTEVGFLISKSSAYGDSKIDDIFVYPELNEYNDQYDRLKNISSEVIINHFNEYNRSIIAGESQSGKSTFAKVLFVKLFEKKYFPIFIVGERKKFKGSLQSNIKRALLEQYENFDLTIIPESRLVIIVDDFHIFADSKKYMNELQDYQNQILIVDDIFKFNKTFVIGKSPYRSFKIREFKASLRDELIQKLISRNGYVGSENHETRERYEILDELTEKIDSALGKIIDNGIMPAYPFFILSIANISLSIEKPLDQEITSQGNCYQALIYLALHGNVLSENIDTYLNLLTEFSYFLYKNRLTKCTEDELGEFFNEYKVKFNLHIEYRELMRNLYSSRILCEDSFGNISFTYRYIQYYFIGKYLAEHLSECKEVIKDIITNLNNNESAYIAIFISHHTKNEALLKELLNNAKSLFMKYELATLKREDFGSFDREFNGLIRDNKERLFSEPDTNRKKILEVKDSEEERIINEDGEYSDTDNLEVEISNFNDELRRSIKSVEVMGLILKNRAGSLERNWIKEIYKEALSVYLRILRSLFELIKEPESQSNIIDYLSVRISSSLADKHSSLDHDKILDFAKRIFWNLNFYIVLSYIDHIISALGSKKLIKIILEISEEIDTPIAELVYLGSTLKYGKFISERDIKKFMNGKGTSEMSKKILRHIYINYVSLHEVTFQDKQKYSHLLGISPK